MIGEKASIENVKAGHCFFKEIEGWMENTEVFYYILRVDNNKVCYNKIYKEDYKMEYHELDLDINIDSLPDDIDEINDQSKKISDKLRKLIGK